MNKRKFIIALSLVGTLVTGGAVSYACIGTSNKEKKNATEVVAQVNKDTELKDTTTTTTTNAEEIKPAVKQEIVQSEVKPVVNTAVAAKPAVKSSNTKTASKNVTTNNNITSNSASSPSIQSNNSTISYWAEVESLILTMVNQERSKAGQATLGLNSQMRTFAREKSKEMIELNYFDHNSPKNGYIQNVISKNGIGYSAVGENIAMLQGADMSATAMATKLMDMWMNSPGHRANILSANFKEIGIGVAKQGNLIKATQVFYTK